MDNQTQGRIRKLLIRDYAGNELRIETNDASTLEQIEKTYRNALNDNSDRLLLADAGNRRIFGDKKEKIGELWPGLGEIEIIALPDTINAADQDDVKRQTIGFIRFLR
jgi:hypothetical protein